MAVVMLKRFQDDGDKMKGYFVIVDSDDALLFEHEFPSNLSVSKEEEDASRLNNQFLLFASLDFVDALRFGSGSAGSRSTSTPTYLKTIDKMREWYISAYLTQGSVRLMLLHDSINDDGIKSFFQEIHELYLKMLLNPLFQWKKRPLQHTGFELKVRTAVKKWL